MLMYDVIRKKRCGEALTREEISFFIENYTKGIIPDYQASAFCMAVCCNGMNPDEVWYLTDAMLHSGDVVDLSMFGEYSVDKHSTGGVGDKTSLIVGPIVATLGGKLAKMSGRGLGHTGGTVDKLESIPGYRTTLEREEFIDIVKNVGMSIIGQSGDLAPADKKLYALRDVTATVDSIPLISSSIMSKKLAAGAHSIVLDVKTGSGAFMKTVEDSRKLADAMVKIGTSAGRNVRAVITNMDVPLGKNVGNALEVIEAVEVLKGKEKGDLYEVCIALASNLVSMFRKIPVEEAKILAENAIADGSAFETMKKWIKAQGGDVSVIEDVSLLPHAPYTKEIVAAEDGYVSKMNAESIGIAASVLGAGRISKEDKIDMSAGIIVYAKTGDFVKKGDTIAVLHTSDEKRFTEAETRFEKAIEFTKEFVEKPVLIF